MHEPYDDVNDDKVLTSSVDIVMGLCGITTLIVGAIVFLYLFADCLMRALGWM